MATPNPLTVPTRREAAELVSAAGIAGPAAELMIRAGAAHRAALRAQDATAAASAWGDLTPGAVSAAVASACILDAVGVGGPLGLGGDSTARHPAFAALGKGRKQASDGGAWSAAIEAARRGALGWGTVTVTVSCYRVQITVEEEEGGLLGGVEPEEDDRDAPWWMALCGVAMLGAEWRAQNRPDLEWLQFDGPPAEWAALYNYLTPGDGCE
jgi:hypothetical protein